jgi:DNA-binding GntR family transcriptional regulator
MRPNRGAIVTSLTSREVEEIFEIRIALEVLAARFAVPYMTQHAVDELNMLRQRLDSARHDPLQWIKRHDELHQFICEIGNRKRLAYELARVRQSVQPYVLMYMRVFETIEMPGLEHQILIDALASGDSQLAETVMRDHVSRPAIGIVKFLRESELAKQASSSEPMRSGSPIRSDAPASPLELEP